MVAEGLGRRLAPKARAKGALDFVFLFGRYVEHFPRKNYDSPVGAFGALPQRAPSAHCAPASAFGAVRINS
jgi:hypothetical protein